MEISGKAELQRCFRYEKETPLTVEIRKLEKEFTEEITFRKNAIVFMTKGKIRFILRDHPEKTLHEGEFIFIPVGGVIRYVVMKEARITIVRTNGKVNLCEGCRIEELYLRSAPKQGYSTEISTLAINRPIGLFLEGLCEAVQDGFLCRDYFDTKAKEMFILLKAYYPREELRDFFSLILTPDTMFSEHIRANYQKYATTKELANAMHMTPKVFSKKFIRIFGELPTDWLRKEKAKSVYLELYTGQQQLVQIVDKYNFSSQSHLNKFCKREFGKNPGEIRKSGVNI